MLEKILRMGLLYDFYGAFLTERQRDCLKMHYFNDFTLSEIAESIGVSRQAVYDIVKRSEQTMEELEAKVGLVAKRQKERQTINEIYQILDSLPAAIRNRQEVSMVLARLAQLGK